MQYLLLVYTDPELMAKLPPEEFSVKMRDCIRHSDDQKTQGKLVMCQQLEPVATARTVRVRNGRAAVLDGPFAETKEQLLGFYIVDCASLDEAIDAAGQIKRDEEGGAFEIRPLRYFDPGANPKGPTS